MSTINHGGEQIINIVYENIARLCKERGTTVKALERELGFGENTIYKWKNSVPGADKLKLVADHFGVTIDELLKEESVEEEK